MTMRDPRPMTWADEVRAETDARDRLRRAFLANLAARGLTQAEAARFSGMEPTLLGREAVRLNVQFLAYRAPLADLDQTQMADYRRMRSKGVSRDEALKVLGRAGGAR